MSRCQSLPYKASNPRSVRGAKSRGWYVVNADKKKWKETCSWLGLNIWTDRACSGYWVASWHNGEFAFENGRDATAFTLMWG